MRSRQVDIEIGIGGGVESMSMVPMMGYNFRQSAFRRRPAHITPTWDSRENVSLKYASLVNNKMSSS